MVAATQFLCSSLMFGCASLPCFSRSQGTEVTIVTGAFAQMSQKDSGAGCAISSEIIVIVVLTMCDLTYQFCQNQTNHSKAVCREI